MEHPADQVAAATGSQQVQAMISLPTKPKGVEKEIQQFRRTVVDDRRTMTAILQQRLKQAEIDSTNRRKEMSACIAEALSKPNRTDSREPMCYPNTEIASNTIYNSVITVDKACRSMLSDYDTLEAMIGKLAGDNKNTVTEKWTQDVEKAERLLKLGHRTALRQAKRVVGVEVHGDDAEAGERGIGVSDEINMELMEGLRYAERGVKRMVKGLAKDKY